MLKVRAQKLGHITVLRMQGQIVAGETDTLRHAVADEYNTGVLILDLARVSRIDAHGLGVLLDLRQSLHAKGIELRLMKVTKLVRQVLEITKLDSVFEFETETQAATIKTKSVTAKQATRREASGDLAIVSCD
jgi:anti-sigma B factor antagonist